MKNNVKVIADNFGYSLHPLLRRQLMLKFSKYENFCLMTENTDTVNEFINIADPKNIYINTLNVQENKVLFNELLTIDECCKRENNSEDVRNIINRLVLEGDKKCQPWITML